ncbi:MAG: response regulator [Alphaproteobacteria bacterium]|nr:response regulator [Alphaproteobacteria bacterium]
MRISPPKLSSIKTKLALIVLAGVVSAMLLTALVTGWQAADRRFHGLKDELHGVASTLAIAVAPSQSKGAHHDVQNILRAIGRMPKVKFARVLDMQGVLIASFGNGVMLQSDANIAEADDEPGLLTLLTMQTYPVEVPVIHAGEEVGRLFLIADVSDLRSVLADSLRFAVVWSLFAAITGLLVAMRLEKSLTGPILDLTTAMRDIRQHHDFTTRVERKSDDETGDLVDAFNDMLNEIRTRDAALARHRETLEQTVDERTRDLREATIAAQAANAAKSDFLATMSHEIRTPMNGMLVMAELLTAAGMPARLQRYADVIVSSGKSLLSIINDILDFSKIEAGRMELEAVPVEPRRLVDEVTRLFAERASSKGLDLAGFVTADVPSVIAADPVRLNQILSNLVNNALKFTESGGVGVRVCLASEFAATTDAGEPVSARPLRFEVTDTGIGIHEDKVATIFEAFSQADQSTTRKFGGTGIGLAICQRLSHAMNGCIEVSSTFGAGSTFALSACFEVLEDAPDLTSLAGRNDEERLPLHIAMPSSPTRNALVEYARNYGYDPILNDQIGTTAIECLAEAAAPASPAIVISRCCELLKKLRSANGRLKLVQLAGFGQSCGHASQSPAHSDTTISWPLATDEISELFAALRTDNLERLRCRDGDASRKPAIASFAGVRVLAADDSAINREVLGEALGRLGVEVVNVEDGVEAVEAVASQSFDLVLMDGSMPQMDGFEAARRIRAWEAAKNRSAMPIIALTAHVIGSQASRWRDAGMNDCLTKPFTIGMLEKTLRTWLPDREAASGVEAAAAIPYGNGAEGSLERHPATRAPAAVADAARAPMSFPLLDPDVLDQIREMQAGDMDLVAKVVALYRTHAPEALRSLRGSWQDAPDDVIATAAHALKSLSRNIGAVRVAEICEVVESGARENSLDRAPPLMKELETALEATLGALPAANPRADSSAAVA